MKKIWLLLIPIVFIVGCMNVMNTPTKRVEEFFAKYQTMDKEVLNELDTTLENDENLGKENKAEYKALMEKQYQNLSYKIKNETVNGNSAVVDVEIEVFDYAKAITRADKYILEHEEEFKDKDGNIDNNKFMKYKIRKMKKVTDKAKYTISFDLEKDDNLWRLSPISDTDINKIHGLYNE